MIVVDTSSLIAVIVKEPEAIAIGRIMKNNDLVLPASVLVEAGILATAKGWLSDLRQLLDQIEADVIPLDENIAEKAVSAFHLYGKGRHKASLNFGDCLSYATAVHLRMPLLYKGDDFVHTDVLSALV
ncbi:MAG: type II toxin-antitoxin system VapC family toxin [Acidobacteriaceae bacterium]|nr:type II toxin-antitoxin system VapC family toxin [Acidobacteriaceae bacterium]MBV9037327.1 type II toxin-antitoxin system VapC family toxin [Acidobacteriaceae bacterium]MBV9224760.1 type II toxin-antitoxin system VapC family toxin [Acidobacteriaceae bacterium]MBV9679176.1 type II toxin-antitoxin system VapC family toxin [Acidobacteriaceae bacterium]